MAIQILRGLEADRLAITPEPGQLLAAKQTDDTWKLFIGDGITAGGIPLTSDSASLLEELTDVPSPNQSSFLVRNATNTAYEWLNITEINGGTF